MNIMSSKSWHARRLHRRWRATLHHGNSDVLYARANALYREDANKPLRKSHDNPYIQKLYEEYLGKPLGEKSEMLLHTHYFNKSID